MQKKLLLLSLTLPLLGGNIISLQYKGVETKVLGAQGSTGFQTIEREIDPACLNVPIDDETIWQGKYAASDVPKACKAEFVSSVGQIQPMKIDAEIETFGELEVLDFIEKMQKIPTCCLSTAAMKTLTVTVLFPVLSICLISIFPSLTLFRRSILRHSKRLASRWKIRSIILRTSRR